MWCTFRPSWGSSHSRCQSARAEEHLCRDLPSVSDARRYLLLGAGRGRLCGCQVCDEPPLRHAGDRAALREALVAGEIDTIATDHCSFNLHGQKDRGRDDFRAIPNGGPGVEHRPVAIATSFEGQLGPEDLCRLMSENPARVFGMYPRKGCLAEGADATCACGIPRRAGPLARRRSIRLWTTRRSRVLRHMAAPRPCL